MGHESWVMGLIKIVDYCRKSLERTLYLIMKCNPHGPHSSPISLITQLAQVTFSSLGREISSGLWRRPFSCSGKPSLIAAFGD